MKLHSYWRSSASWRVRIVLAWKGLEYEYCAVDISPERSSQHAPEYQDLNAMRQVPVLEWVEDGRRERLTQSVAICEYLEARFPAPPLLPSDPLQRARMREAVEIVNAGTQPLQNTGVLQKVRALGGDAASQAFGREAIAKGLSALEAHAAKHAGAFAIGDTLTLADVFLVPQLYNATRFGVDVAPFPKLVELTARASLHAAFLAAHPDRQPDAPAAQTAKAKL